MRKEIRLEKNYLRIPLIRNGQTQKVSFLVDGEKVLEFLIPVKADGKGTETGAFAELSVREWKGRVLVLETEGAEALPEGMVQADERMEKNQDVYPEIHFTPVSGWLNDPNGLCFYNGKYHLFFQHNMFDTEWNNMSWGHAVSTDLLHWTQMDEALLPDEDGVMYSGGAISNFRGEALCPKDAMILFYTCAGGRSEWSEGKLFTQKAAYSEDGEHFHKLPGVLIPHIVEENRDPKVGWFGEKQQYYMVLYLSGHEYAVFTSKDLKDWKETQRLEIEESWECPDLIRFTKPDGTEQWIFWTADGCYVQGDFDGEKFTGTEPARCLYANKVPYAAQTFWGSDRVLQIPWLRLRWEDKPYQSAMGIPRELQIVEQNGEEVLAAHLPEELWRQRTGLWKGIPGEGAEIKPAENVCLLVAVDNKENQNFEIQMRGTSVCWDAKEGILRVGEETFSFSGVSDLNAVLDRDILEVSCNNDTTCIYCKVESVSSDRLVLSGNAEMEAAAVV